MVWSSDLAYAIGLLTTDGSLSKDGRHIELTSKDSEQIENFKKIFKLKNRTGVKHSGFNKSGLYYRVQFGNVKLYKFLLEIGLRPNKTTGVKDILVPDRYFADFLRGLLDGDGCTVSFWDKVWKSSFRLYLKFVSASREHLKWINQKTVVLYHVHGSIGFSGRSIYQLEYAKKNSLILINKMYHGNDITYLRRKKFKIDQALSIISRQQAGMLKPVDRHA